MFEFLFKYPLALFQQGEFTLTVPWLWYGGAVAAAAIFSLLLYARAKGKTRVADRLALMALRTALLAAILFSLCQPLLVSSAFVPSRGVVGVLVDDSRSMRIADSNGAARADAVRSALAPGPDGFLNALRERFGVRLFRFGASAERIDDVAELGFNAGKTDLGRALAGAHHALAGVALAGLIIISDGAAEADPALAEALLGLRANGVPLYTVGVGQERYANDIELGPLDLPRTALNGSALVAEFTLRQHGHAGAKLPLIVEEEGRILSSEEITLGQDGEAQALRAHFTLNDPGPRRLKFRIPLQSGESVSHNNEREALIQVLDRKEKILYVEGEPRFDLKFIRRAVSDDPNLQVVALLRTAENKFYRLGIDTPEELSKGFPKTRAELFAYRGLILGSVEAGFFSREQLQLIADFVGERGGGLLMLGGKHAFAEGGYADTALADVLPVRLTHNPAGGGVREIQLLPTEAGKAHPVLQLGASEQASLERWKTLPALTMVNPLDAAKPGATILLQSASDKWIGLAAQRYGRGRVLAFPVQDRLAVEDAPAIALDDRSHELFWRQLLRWLVSATPERVAVSASAENVAPAETVTVSAEVRDADFRTVNNATVQALAISPSGAEQTIALAWADQEGVYRAAFTPTEQGLYELRVNAQTGQEKSPEAALYFNVDADAHEAYGSEMQAGLLKRIAANSGGRFYTPDQLPALARAIPQPQSGAKVTEHYELWDMPALLLLMVGLAGLEWGYRRWRGLP
ncbi:MAG: glutamine amidotransferase [Gammaproteobacteria bacterium]